MRGPSKSLRSQVRQPNPTAATLASHGCGRAQKCMHRLNHKADMAVSTHSAHRLSTQTHTHQQPTLPCQCDSQERGSMARACIDASGCILQQHYAWTHTAVCKECSSWAALRRRVLIHSGQLTKCKASALQPIGGATRPCHPAVDEACPCTCQKVCHMHGALRHLSSAMNTTGLWSLALNGTIQALHGAHGTPQLYMCVTRQAGCHLLLLLP